MRLTREQAKKLGVDVPKRPSKYKNRRTEYNGRMYDSKAEAEYAEYLDRIGRWWLRQVPVQLGDIRYVPDFLVATAGGVYFLDVKGVETSRFKQVRRLWPKYGPAPLWVVKRTRSGSASGWSHETIEGKQ